MRLIFALLAQKSSAFQKSASCDEIVQQSMLRILSKSKIGFINQYPKMLGRSYKT
jgi:hypothetical protein